jgi:class 3 adenylate cyclase
VLVCLNCGQENPEGFRFCGACAAPIGDEAPPQREERKVVSVLFCDLVGSTARAERLDPEDVRAMLSHYHARVRTELERFGGTVEKFIGDAVVALFGAPVAHEDDPERAVRAALAIRDWVGEDADMHVRIAVNTGEALVALGARPAAGEGMASGDVVNTAARLQAAAPVDGILVGEQTYRSTERAIEYRAAEPVVAKGKSEPLAVWEVVQARSRFGVDLARPSGPLVGREREVELLVAALTRAYDEQSAQLVTLVGVPGMGKSRLLAELFAAIDRGDRLVTWRQGRSLPYGEGVSFWALGEMVKAQAGILETDAPADAAVKLDETVVRLLPDEAEARWVESHLHPLAGLASDDDAAADRRGEAFAAWRRFFEALAEQRPLVLIFEDLHWADDGLLDFVDQLVDWLTDVPVLVVASARPELLARRPAWGGGKANATTVSLSPLSDEETARLVHALLERSVLPAEVQSALLERAGGNPLYAEEFVRMLAERGMPTWSCPSPCRGSSPRASTASSPRTRASSRTPPWSARCSGRARSPRSATPSASQWRSGCTRSNGASSSGASGTALSPARASTRSATCSSVTSLTARSRARDAPSDTAVPRSGSNRLAAPTTTPTYSRTTTSPRSSSRAPPASTPACSRARRRVHSNAPATAPSR